jgi:hypothetical protein
MLLKKKSRTAMHTRPAAITIDAARRFLVGDTAHTQPCVSQGFLFS